MSDERKCECGGWLFINDKDSKKCRCCGTRIITELSCHSCGKHLTRVVINELSLNHNNWTVDAEENA